MDYCETCIIGKSVPAEFIAIKGQGIPLLGKDTAVKFGVCKSKLVLQMTKLRLRMWQA